MEEGPPWRRSSQRQEQKPAMERGADDVGEARRDPCEETEHQREHSRCCHQMPKCGSLINRAHGMR